VEAELFHADGHGEANNRFFRNFAIAPKNGIK
jgi:hypothetical protein